MKKTTLRALAIALSTVLAASALPMSTFAEDAETSFHVEWNLRITETRENTVYIDPAELENGDYTFNAALYMNSEDDVPAGIKFCDARWDGYDANGAPTGLIRFTNLSGMRDPNETMNRDYTLEDLNPDGTIGTTDFVAAYVPTCFSHLIERNGVNKIHSTWLSLLNDYAASFDSTTIYSAGPYKVTFKTDDGIEYVCDVTWDEKTGTATTVQTFEEYTRYSIPQQLVIEDYDPTIPEGEPIPSSSRSITAHNMGQTAYNWLGGKSDAFPFTTFDVVIDADTPEGVYYVGFDNGSSNRRNYIGVKVDESGWYEDVYPENLAPDALDENGDPLTMPVTGNIVSRVNDTENWLKIVVGNPEAAEAEETSGDVNMDGTVDI
ncbi:MAG: hypothetical protein ACI4JQ_04890, partial [Ruminococcus sp.]